jgi:hypothetical protein
VKGKPFPPCAIFLILEDTDLHGIILGYERIVVSPCIPNPVPCIRCQQSGTHSKGVSSALCGNCGDSGHGVLFFQTTLLRHLLWSSCGWWHNISVNRCLKWPPSISIHMAVHRMPFSWTYHEMFVIATWSPPMESLIVREGLHKRAPGAPPQEHIRVRSGDQECREIALDM